MILRVSTSPIYRRLFELPGTQLTCVGISSAHAVSLKSQTQATPGGRRKYYVVHVLGLAFLVHGQEMLQNA